MNRTCVREILTQFLRRSFTRCFLFSMLVRVLRVNSCLDSLYELSCRIAYEIQHGSFGSKLRKVLTMILDDSELSGQ